MSLWTEQQDTQLAELWRTGLSASQIASRFPGRSRCAIIGRVHRLDLPKRTTSSNPRPRKITRKLMPKAAPSPSQADPFLLTIDELFGRCRFVCEAVEWGRARYCGHPAHAGSSWCENHHAVVFRPREMAVAA